jgi:hypothetical protein
MKLRCSRYHYKSVFRPVSLLLPHNYLSWYTNTSQVYRYPIKVLALHNTTTPMIDLRSDLRVVIVVGP